MKTLLTTLFIIFLSFVGNTVSANDALSDNLIDFNIASSYTSESLYKINASLVEAYPELLEMEIIGYSYDQQPIYVIRLGNTLNHSNLYVNKMHGLIESGTHSREVANPVLTSKILSDYVIDYYKDDYLKDVHIKDLLEHCVLHFVINSNPDGYNIAKHGSLSITTENAYNYLLSIEDTDYSNYKANIRGVDLNRNYQDCYYDIPTGKWVDKWSVKENSYTSDKASGAYYAGEFPGSEVETQIMMAYLLSYDFRYYLSFHSKGEVIYGNFTYLDETSQAYISTYKDLASAITGYAIPPYYESELSSGYMSDFIVNNTLKPAITVETIPSNVTLPFIDASHLSKAYEDTYTLPYRFMQTALDDGYFDYLLYVDGRYQRDFQNELYAQAIASQQNGVIIKREDTWPSLYLGTTFTLEKFLYAVTHGYMTIDQAYASFLTRDDFQSIRLDFTE